MSVKQQEKIEVICEVCKQPRIISRGTHQQALKRNGFYRCAKCSPQRTKEFWNNLERKLSHSNSIKSSTEYYDSLSARNEKLLGENNGMFGKQHSPETITKMSKSRRGKIGKNATAWKGGKTSFTKRIKGLMHTRYNWFFRVFQRDNYKCRWCCSAENLDAHHIDPVVKIIKRITESIQFVDDNSKINYVIQHVDIIDKDLVNGITLCRPCHKKAHSNWGSHVSP